MKKKIQEKKKEFEKRQKEAFELFMRVHFPDPVCRNLLMTSVGKN